MTMSKLREEEEECPNDYERQWQHEIAYDVRNIVENETAIEAVDESQRKSDLELI